MSPESSQDERTSEQMLEDQVASFFSGSEGTTETTQESAEGQSNEETAQEGQTATTQTSQESQVSTAESGADEGVDDSDDAGVLRQQLAQLMGQVAEMQMNNASQQAAVQDLGMQLPEKASEVTTLDFLQGADPADILSDPATFNTLLNRVATAAAQAGKRAAIEHTLRSIPEVVQRSTNQQISVNRTVEEFYKKNPDLVPFKAAMATAAINVHGKNPALSLDKIMEESATNVREVLRLRNTKVAKKPVQPAAVHTGGGGVERSTRGRQLTPMEAQIEKMLANA